MKKIRHITDAAMIVALMAVLLLMSNLTGGVLVTWFAFLLPVPVTIYGLKYNWKTSIIAAISTILVSLLINWMVGLLYVLPSCLVAVIYSYILKSKIKFSGKISIMITGSIIINVLTTVIFSKALFGYTIIEDTLALSDTVLKTLQLIMDIPEWMRNTLQALFISVIPAVIVVTSYMETIITYFVISVVTKKLLNITLEGIYIAFNVAVPKIITFIFLPLSLISLGFMNVIVEYETIGFVQVIITLGINIFVILMLLYILEGIVVSSMYFTKLNKRYLNLITILLMFSFPLALAVVGFIDSVFSIRKKLIYN